MKIQKLIGITVLALALTGCGDDTSKEINCQNEDALNLLREAYSQGSTGKFIKSYEFTNRAKLLVDAGIEVPKDKMYHEDNESYLDIKNKLKITFDNIVTVEIDTVTQKYSCMADIFYEFPDKDGNPVNLSTNEARYTVYPVNGGEKVGVKYFEQSVLDTREGLVQHMANAAGLAAPLEIIFSNEELDIITKQEQAIKNEYDQKIQRIRDKAEFESSYTKDRRFKQIAFSFVEKLVADTYFNGNIQKGSDTLIKRYLMLGSDKFDYDLLREYQALLVESRLKHEVISMSYQLQEADATVKKVNSNIVNFVINELKTQFSDNEFRPVFCEHFAQIAMSEKQQVDKELILESCNSLLSDYPGAIPLVSDILEDNQLIF